MAATTEQLTGQSDQLVSALAFFRTGDQGYVAVHRSSAANSVGRISGPAWTPKETGHAVPKESGAAAKAGVALHLKDKLADLDGEFERY
jgi:hypothetical protein